MEKVLQVKNLHKTYKTGFLLERKKVLHGVSFSVERGQIVGLLGPNGAGKTTTIKSILGITPVDSGEILIFGERLSKSAKAKIGYLPEAPYFYDYLTGMELLSAFSRFYGGVKRERIEEVLSLVGLSEASKKRVRTYSKGMLQRLGLAQAILHDPHLIILDEPMSGLDPIGRREFREIINRLREEGKTILFSSHILQDVEMICDHVVMIYQGKVIKKGVLEEMLQEEVRFFEVTVEGVELEGMEAERKSGNRVLYRAESEEQVQEIIKRTMEKGGKVRAVVPRALTLEEIFIREVGKNEGSA